MYKIKASGMSRFDLIKVSQMKIITYENLYVINWGLDSELKVLGVSEKEAVDVFMTFHKPKKYEIFSIDKLEKDVVRFAI